MPHPLPAARHRASGEEPSGAAGRAGRGNAGTLATVADEHVPRALRATAAGRLLLALATAEDRRALAVDEPLAPGIRRDERAGSKAAAAVLHTLI